MAPRTWAARVQAALARVPSKPPHGMELARQAIIVVMGLAGTGILLYVLFFAPMLGARPAAPPPGTPAATTPAAAGAGTGKPQADAGARDVHVPAQAQVPTPQPSPPPPALGTLLPPVAGHVLVPFGWAYSRTLADWRLHGGLSLGATAGEPVHAAAAGTVASVARDPLWGEMVTVDDGGTVRTEYASLARVAVTLGQRVVPGQVLGTAGDTGALETGLGPHVYFAVLENGQPVDPAPLLAQP